MLNFACRNVLDIQATAVFTVNQQLQSLLLPTAVILCHQIVI